MRKIWICLALAALPVFADPIPGCFTESLTNYENLSAGCSVGDVVFSNFAYNPHLGPSFSADQITVTPVAGPSTGLEFSLNGYTANGLTVMDNGITYNTATDNGQMTIVQLQEILNASFTGLGQTAVRDIGTTSGIIPFSMTTHEQLLGSQPTDSVDVPATNQVYSNYDLYADAATGSATITSVTNLFVETPEPEFLLPLGLAGLAILWRYRRQARRLNLLVR